MAKLVEMITPTWVAENNDDVVPVYDPAIDGESKELIRCRNCKHGMWTHFFSEVACRGNYNYIHDPDWFCADAQRKET